MNAHCSHGPAHGRVLGTTWSEITNIGVERDEFYFMWYKKVPENTAILDVI